MREIKKYKKSAKYVELEVKHIQHKLDLIDNTALREKEPRNNQQPILEQTLFQSRYGSINLFINFIGSSMFTKKGKELGNLYYIYLYSSKPYYLQPIYSVS